VAADDLTLQPDFSLDSTQKFDTIVTEFENGFEQRRPRWGTSLKRWKFVYKNRTSTEIAALRTLFTTKKGRFSSWLWTDPTDSVQRTVRFDSDELTLSLKAYGVYDASIDVIEVK